MVDSLGQLPRIYVHFLVESNFRTEIIMVNMGRNLWPAEAMHLVFYQRQLNSRCCQHHIILEVPISLWVTLRKVMSLNFWWLNGFCTGKSTPRSAVHAGVWCYLLSYQIRQRRKITRRYPTLWKQAGLLDPTWVVLVLILLETRMNMFAATGCCLKLSVR